MLGNGGLDKLEAGVKFVVTQQRDVIGHLDVLRQQRCHNAQIGCGLLLSHAHDGEVSF